MVFSYPTRIGRVKCYDKDHQCPICQGTGICHTYFGGAPCMMCNQTGDLRNRRKSSIHNSGSVKHE